LGEPADRERREVATRNFLGRDSIEQGERPGWSRDEGGDRGLPAGRREAGVGGDERVRRAAVRDSPANGTSATVSTVSELMSGA